MIVKAVSYELTDPTIDSQIITLKASGAGVFFRRQFPKVCRASYSQGF